MKEIDKDFSHIFTDHSTLAPLNGNHNETDQSSMQIGPFIQQSISSRITRSALSECNGSEIIDCVLGTCLELEQAFINFYFWIFIVFLIIINTATIF